MVELSVGAEERTCPAGPAAEAGTDALVRLSMGVAWFLLGSALVRIVGLRPPASSAPVASGVPARRLPPRQCGAGRCRRGPLALPCGHAPATSAPEGSLPWPRPGSGCPEVARGPRCPTCARFESSFCSGSAHPRGSRCAAASFLYELVVGVTTPPNNWDSLCTSPRPGRCMAPVPRGRADSERDGTARHQRRSPERGDRDSLQHGAACCMLDDAPVPGGVLVARVGLRDRATRRIRREAPRPSRAPRSVVPAEIAFGLVTTQTISLSLHSSPRRRTSFSRAVESTLRCRLGRRARARN